MPSPQPLPSPIAMGEGLVADGRGCHDDRPGLETPPDVNKPLAPRTGRGVGVRAVTGSGDKHLASPLPE